MKKNIPLLISALSSIFLFNCSTDQIAERDLNGDINSNDLSTKSVKLPISDISASTQQSSNPANNVIDDSYDTRWSGYGDSASLDIDLGAVTTVDYINIAYYKGDLRKSYFSYWVSNDGDSWTYVQDKISSGTTSDYETFDLSNKSTRYIRIENTGNSESLWNSITEIDVYGTSSIASSNSTSTPSSSTPVISESGTFNLEDFEIETSWFSSGSNYRRTESFDYDSIDNERWYDKSGDLYTLRCEARDGNRTEWKERSGKESSLSVNKIMEYTTKITSEPENGVTIAQIHNRGGVKRPYVRVYLEHGEILIKETTSDPSKNSASYKTYDEDLEYVNGTDLTLKIETKSGKARITLTTTKGSYSKTLTPSKNWDDFSDQYYLKAGVYTEGDDKEPKSTFSKFLFTRN